MIDLLKAFIAKNKLFLPADRILLAISGGIDSVVMADLFHRSGFLFGIAHCNFSLRGQESDTEEDFTRQLARKYKVPFFSKRFETSEYASVNGISVQMAARDLRYCWFEEIRKSGKFKFIATAHQLDDQVETFLINMVRGTGIAGLHGISIKESSVIRPMLFAWRKDIAAYASEHRIGYKEDSSNIEEKYIRNKIRLKLIPLLEQINPNFRRTINSEIKILRGWEQLGSKELLKNSSRFCNSQSGNTIIDLKVLRGLPQPELYAWETLSSYNFNPDVVSDILSSPEESSGKVFLSPTHRAIKDRETIILQSRLSLTVATGRMISANTKRITKPLKLRFSIVDHMKDKEIPAGKEFASLDFDKLSFPLEIRRWKAGDSFHPFGMKGKKKVSDLLIDEKVSLPDKENTYVLCSSGRIAWVIGRRIDQRFRITAKTTKIFRVHR
ncbi:MAG: tRNA lysidine(34) synthetase TilS [Bacteroidetes bacterium]|nr:tRNA lysidine(34) synthetase TilS [Bacteroidota bacterium]